MTLFTLQGTNFPNLIFDHFFTKGGNDDNMYVSKSLLSLGQ